jgi:1-acyl-sn-glycerol-3-phosphate acyltransferase
MKDLRVFMLICLMLIFAAACGVALCCLGGGFGDFGWLWQLPVGFLGGFLVAAGLAFAFLLIACAVVDPDKSRDKDSPFYRGIARWYIQLILTVARIRVHTQGLEKTPKEGRFLLVCNHLHEADPAILLHYFKNSQLAFVSKQENHDMFIVGKLMPMMLCPLINRENDRQALQTILRCIQLLKEDKVSIGIFPEGYIHKKRKLQHFRPGVFKIAQKAGVPIVVCTIRNTHYVVKNFLKGKPSDVDLHLLEVIPAQELQGKTTTQIAQRVYDLMAADLGPENILSPEEENT